MTTSGQQGSARDRRKPTPTQGGESPSGSVPIRPPRPSGIRRLFRRQGVGDVYRLDTVEYRLEKSVGSGSGEAKGKSETWRAVRLGANQADVFIKVFQSPKQPDEQERNDPEQGPELLKRCERFESRHREVVRRLSRPRVGAGALVEPLDFGLPKESLSYVKVYPWIPNAEIITRERASSWSRTERLVFLRTLMLALWELHHLGIAHGDIKPENILVAKLPVGPVARLIDFDEAFLADNPPQSLEEVEVGTTIMTPEWKVLENSDRGVGLKDISLGIRTDLFQLALVLERVFGSGDVTWITRQNQDLYDDADYSLAGATPNCGDLGLGLPRIAQLMGDCLHRQPSRRPSIDLILSAMGVSAP